MLVWLFTSLTTGPGVFLLYMEFVHILFTMVLSTP